MREENADLIRRTFERMNSRDVEGAKELADPEIELNTRFVAISGRPYRGHEGVEQWFDDLVESWQEVDQVIDRLIEVDDDRMISVIRFKGRGRGSGIEIDQEIATIWTIRDGKILAVETHGSVEEARAAAGLPENAAE